MAPPIDQAPYPFRCPRAVDRDDIDHVVRRHLHAADSIAAIAADANPFVRYRALFHSHTVARLRGVTDEEYVELVRRIDRAITSIDGHGFRMTPFRRCDQLSDRIGLRAGGVWVKDETGNVSGSHKARHLMGIMLYLEVVARLGLACPANPESATTPTPPATDRLPTDDWPLTAGRRPSTTDHRPLSIASCGNAALAAAVVARAAGWPLQVHVPPSAAPSVLARLAAMGADIRVCRRQPTVAGDPCYHSFRESIAAGALPFCVQGSDNGLTIEGGETLAWEMIEELAGTRLDRLIVQVGGGALASACVQAFSDAGALGWIDYLPRIFTVQTTGAHPLERAYNRLAGRILARLVEEGVIGQPVPHDARARALLIREHFGLRAVREELTYARTHRSAFMWPWEHEPRSVAHGILDDETYDWAAVVEGMLQTGGWPLVVDEATLVSAHALAHETTRVDVCHTGSAGLAGLMALLETSDRPAVDEHVAVIFSGVQRDVPTGR